jgi:hypothetical protein
MNRISGKTSFVTTEYEATNRVLRILGVSMDEQTVTPYILVTLDNTELAVPSLWRSIVVVVVVHRCPCHCGTRHHHTSHALKLCWPSTSVCHASVCLSLGFRALLYVGIVRSVFDL